MNSGSLEALFRSPYLRSTLHFRSNPTPDIFHASLGRTLAFTPVNLQAPISANTFVYKSRRPDENVGVDACISLSDLSFEQRAKFTACKRFERCGTARTFLSSPRHVL